MDTAAGTMYRVLDGPSLVGVDLPDGRYPIPYSEAFYTDLVAYEHHLGDTSLGQQLADKYLRHKTVVLIERQAPISRTHESALLEAMALSMMMKDTGLRHLSPDDGVEVKIVGPLGIYLFDEPAAAVRFRPAVPPGPDRQGHHLPNRCRPGRRTVRRRYGHRSGRLSLTNEVRSR